jgi:uncharacterized protein YijF (DUF1287 family)
LSNAALELTKDKVTYDPSYVKLKYPNGDVAKDKGVCTDVIIRAYRKLGIDLQKEVHEDLKANFYKYPNLKKWGLKKPDTNIDHRRVPNLEVFFERKGEKLAVTQNPSDYKTGDLVTWMIGDKLPHIGIVTHKKSADGKRNLICTMWVADRYWKIVCLAGGLWGIFGMVDNGAICQLVNMSLNIAN